MKKVLVRLSIFILLISSILMIGCNSSNFKITANFLNLERNINDKIKLSDCYDISKGNYKIDVEIDDENVLSLIDGYLVCVNEGETKVTIKASVRKKEKSVSFIVKVKEKDVFASEINCETTQVYINFVETSESLLNFEILPTNYNGEILVESSNSEIATYNYNSSKIVAHKTGECELVIKAKLSSDTYIEKRVKVIVDNNIYTSSFSLVDNKTSLTMLTSSMGDIDYILSSQNVTKKPTFSVSSNLVAVTSNGKIITSNKTGGVEINVKYYINYFEYKETKITLNVIDKTEIESVKFYNSKGSEVNSFIVGENYEYTMEIVFEEEFDVKNLVLPNNINIKEILTASSNTHKLKISFNNAEISDFCIVYSNITDLSSFNAEFKIENCKFVDLNNCEIEVKNEDMLLTPISDYYVLNLFDNTIYEGEDLFDFAEINLKYDSKNLSEFITLESGEDNLVLRFAENKILANSQGASEVKVYLFHELITTLKLKVEEIVAEEILIEKLSYTLYLNQSVDLEVFLDIPYAYENEIRIEEVDTNCLEIKGNNIKAIRESESRVNVKISCGSLEKFIEVFIKPIPTKIEIFNLYDMSIIENEIEITLKGDLTLGFKVYSNEDLLSNEVLTLHYVEEIGGVKSDKSDKLSVTTNSSSFSDMLMLKAKATGVQYVEISLLNYPTLTKTIKIIIV